MAKCGKDLIISEDNTLTKISTNAWENAAFGMEWFESNTNDIIKWTIKVITTTREDACGINIGIISKEFDVNDSFYKTKRAGLHFPFYFNSNGKHVYKDGKSVSSNYMPRYTSSTEIIMELNLKKAQLIFYLDGKCYGVAVDNIVKDHNFKYKFAISIFFLWCKDKAIQF